MCSSGGPMADLSMKKLKTKKYKCLDCGNDFYLLFNFFYYILNLINYFYFSDFMIMYRLYCH